VPKGGTNVTRIRVDGFMRISYTYSPGCRQDPADVNYVQCAQTIVPADQRSGLGPVGVVRSYVGGIWDQTIGGAIGMVQCNFDDTWRRLTFQSTFSMDRPYIDISVPKAVVPQAGRLT
jgi:hypothetical protein